MSNIDKFKEKLQIDEHALEIALREHPALIYDVGLELVRAISVRDQAKQELDEISALAAKDLRDYAVKHDSKITDKAVEAEVSVDKKVLTATDRFLDAKYDAAKWQVLKEAFEQRSYALSKLCDLYLANYYSNIEKRGTSDFKTAQADRVKTELATRRRVNPQ